MAWNCLTPAWRERVLNTLLTMQSHTGEGLYLRLLDLVVSLRPLNLDRVNEFEVFLQLGANENQNSILTVAKLLRGILLRWHRESPKELNRPGAKIAKKTEHRELRTKNHALRTGEGT